MSSMTILNVECSSCERTFRTLKEKQKRVLECPFCHEGVEMDKEDYEDICLELPEPPK